MVGSGLILDDLVPPVPCVDGQKVCVELEHILRRLFTLGCCLICGVHGLLQLGYYVGKRRVELVELASTVVLLKSLKDCLEVSVWPEVPSSSNSWLFSCLILARCST